MEGPSVDAIEELINKGKFAEAESLLGELDQEARIVYSAKMEAVKGNWKRALKILLPVLNKKDDRVARLAGYIFFNNDDYQKAYAYFRAVKKKTVEDDFMLTLLATFHEDVQTAKEYLRSAFAKDSSRLKELMEYFYKTLVEPHPHMTLSEKRELRKILQQQNI